MPPLGTEHPPQNPNKTTDSDQGGAESGAPGALPAISDPDLARLINAWPSLPPAVRRGISAMIEAAEEEGT